MYYEIVAREGDILLNYVTRYTWKHVLDSISVSSQRLDKNRNENNYVNNLRWK